jgi:hypothetical protein
LRQPLLSVLLCAGLLSLAGPAIAAPAITLAEAGFAAGPGADYDISKTLAIGTHVDVVWCGTHENWCLVDIHNKRGWVPLASLTFKVPHAVTLDADGANSNGGSTVAAGGARNPKAAEAVTELKPQGGNGPVFTPVNPGIVLINP